MFSVLSVAYVVVLIVTDQKDLLITAKDFPGVKIGDVLEIYHPEEEFRSVEVGCECNGIIIRVCVCVRTCMCVCVSNNARTFLHCYTTALIFFLFCLTVTFILTLNVHILIFHLLCFSVQIPHDLPGEACGKALQRADAAQVV